MTIQNVVSDNTKSIDKLVHFLDFHVRGKRQLC